MIREAVIIKFTTPANLASKKLSRKTTPKPFCERGWAGKAKLDAVVHDGKFLQAKYSVPEYFLNQGIEFQ